MLWKMIHIKLKLSLIKSRAMIFTRPHNYIMESRLLTRNSTSYFHPEVTSNCFFIPRLSLTPYFLLLAPYFLLLISHFLVDSKL